MKKLLFTLAAAASFAAMADGDPNKRTEVPGDIDLIGFENFSVLTNVVDRDDYGNESANTTQWVSTTGDDESIVKSYGGDNASAPTNAVPAPFADLDPNTKYLALDTNGGELQRYLSPKVDNSYASTNVAPTGTYIDTLVQFTVTEDDAPSVDADTKLAIWLGVDEGTTNLHVKGNLWDYQAETIVPAVQDFVLTGKTIEPGTWYRLTVKIIPNVLASASGYLISGFQISVDGTEMAAAVAPFASDFLTFLSSAEVSFASADIQTLVGVNKLIPCIQANIGAADDPVTITSVGFQGTGAIDDLVVTEIDPSPTPSVVDFTLTLTGDANTTLGAVTYTVGEGEPQSVTLENDAASIVSNATVTIAAPTFAEGYQLAALTVDGTPVVSPTFPYSFTITADTTIAITAEPIPAVEDWVENPATDITAGQTAAQAYPGLASSALASADAQKLTVWAKANSIAYTDIKNDTTGTYVEAYLLNCAVADVADEKEEFVANITVVNGVPVVTPPSGKTYNGTLQLKGKVNLTDATWTDVGAASTTYKFYMYELSL